MSNGVLGRISSFKRDVLVAVLVLCAIAAGLAGAASASASGWWLGDFFDGSASGQAIYEDMAIQPQAVRVDDKVYVVYQGLDLEPYIVAFPDGGSIEGPYWIGKNNLASKRDAHGAPSILFDAKRDRLHVFWGAHGTRLQHGWARRDDISKWFYKAWRPVSADDPTMESPFAERVTYPQVFSDDDGTAHLFFRRDTVAASPQQDVAPQHSWMHATSIDGGTNWSVETTPVIRSEKDAPTTDRSWYAHFRKGADNRIHAVFTLLDRKKNVPMNQTMFVRSGIYYMQRDGADGVWRDVAGNSMEDTMSAGVLRSAMETPTAQAVIEPFSDAGPYHNQMVCADDGDGNPGVLYLAGDGGYGPEAYEWRFARHDGESWVTTSVAHTDHFFDAGTLEYNRDGTIDAFLTTGGTRGEGSTLNDAMRTMDRGGDIHQFTSDDDGDTWADLGALKSADPDKGVMYNDPQIVVGHEAVPGGPRVLFGEWNNDVTNFVHKIYLWGDNGFRGKEFFPEVTRLSGDNRFETAVKVSQEGFRLGAGTVVVATGQGYADALSGVTLAHAYGAPLLLVSGDSTPQSVREEIVRLKATTVLVLGGEAAVSQAAADQLKVGNVKTVRRIGGADRYAVAANIAREVATRRGRTSPVAFVVSGEKFPDALSAAPLSAVRGAPLLLVHSGGIPSATRDVIRSLGVTQTVIVGGTSSVSAEVASGLPSPVRVAGHDRYDTAAAVAELALLGDSAAGVPASLKMDRFVLANGQDFPDALAGGALAARVRGPIVLTQPSVMTARSRALLDTYAFNVLDAYVVGGERAISPRVVLDPDGLSGSLYERQAAP